MYDYNYNVYPPNQITGYAIAYLFVKYDRLSFYCKFEQIKIDWLIEKPLAQQCWQPIVTSQTVKISSHKEQKTYILATPHRHNVTVINKRTTVVVKNTNIIDQVNMI